MVSLEELDREQMTLEYIGIDGCRLGWFYVAFSRRGAYEIGVLNKFSEIKKLLDDASQILVDIPIGLPSKGHESRLCDTEARKMISPRGSCVFPAPARSALGLGSYQACSEENHRVLGKRLSRQSWAITDKIKEVDDFMRVNKPGKAIREMHPEVAFCRNTGIAPRRVTWKPAQNTFEEKSRGMTFWMRLLGRFWLGRRRRLGLCRLSR